MGALTHTAHLKGGPLDGREHRTPFRYKRLSIVTRQHGPVRYELALPLDGRRAIYVHRP